MAKADRLSSLLITQAKGEGFETRKQGYRFHVVEKRMRLVAALEIVIRNSRAQMVNVVESDVAREPLQDLGQLVKRAALQRRSCEIPILTPLPINSLKLML